MIASPVSLPPRWYLARRLDGCPARFHLDRRTGGPTSPSARADGIRSQSASRALPPIAATRIKVGAAQGCTRPFPDLRGRPIEVRFRGAADIRAGSQNRRLRAHAGHAHELDGVSEADIRREHANDGLGLSGRRLQLWFVEWETHSGVEAMGSSRWRGMRRGSRCAWKRFSRAGTGRACRSSTGASRARRGTRHGKVRLR